MTDGINPCGCKPPNTINSTVKINHDINQNANISISTEGLLEVSASSKLNTTNFNLNVIAGSIEVIDPVSVKEFVISPGGTRNFYGPLTVVSFFKVEGISTFNSDITVTNTSVEFKSGAEIYIGSNCKLNLLNGNLSNQANVSLFGSCILLNNGSLYNLTVTVL